MVKVRIWDLPLRLFHWMLVALVSFSWVSGEFGADLGPWAADWHQQSGLAILALLLFRVAWGFVGSTHARFSNFVRGPRAVLAYLGELTGRATARPVVGHNPLGGWSVVALLTCLSVQVVTGLFISDEDLGIEGPLAHLVSGTTSDRLAEIHEVNVLVLLALVATHLSAIAFYWLAKGENLVKPMVTGRKSVPPALADAAARGGHPLLALALLAASAAAVWFVAEGL